MRERVCEVLSPPKGTPPPFYSPRKGGGWIQKGTMIKRRKPQGWDVIRPSLPQQSVAGPAVLADGDGDHSSPTLRPVAMVADGRRLGVLWMTPRW